MPIPDHYALPDGHVARKDQDAAFDEHRARLVVTVWDRESPINGVPADHWLGRPDVPASGDVYLIGDGTPGHAAMFQPHHPEGGPISPGQGQHAGDAHADQLAAQRAHADLLPPGPDGNPHPSMADPEVARVVRYAARSRTPAELDSIKVTQSRPIGGTA